ncbi:MAG: capsule assembly Wzi family protein, partial [Chitinophagaceae bacterium]
PYLYRMAQKGLIEFRDIIRPVSRQHIYEQLDTLSKKSAQLSRLEKLELDFYLQEYRPINVTDTAAANTKLLRKDANQRWRAFSAVTKDFQLHVDPILGAGVVSQGDERFRQVSNGLQFWGTAKRWGFQFYYRDVTETGDGLQTFRNESPETGIIRVGNSGQRQQNHSEIRAALTYSWKKSTLSLGKDQYLWGYGENGRIVNSEKSPSFTYVRWDYQPLPWMRFQYIHGWLNSNLVDSNRTYGTGTTGVFDDVRLIFRNKYIASHTLEITPFRGLNLSLGESIVYSDRLDPGFLIPFNFFKIYDNNRSFNNLNAGNNGQFFAQVSSRNHIKNTHLYATLFIDEIRVSTMFDPAKSRNQIGFNAGFNVTDFLVHYLTVGAEYTRVNPFVYQNLVPTQNYTHHDHLMGDWMGANSDRLIAFVRYNPVPRLRLNMRYQHIRKGAPGSIWDQYYAQPQPGFLSDFQFNRRDIHLGFQYEWINNLYITGNVQLRKREAAANGIIVNQNLTQFGMSYGLH